MKKTTKNIIIALAVLLVLGGAVAALVLTSPKQEAESSSESSVSSEALAKIIDKQIGDIKDIEVKNNESGETLRLLPVKGAADSEAADTFTVEGLENADVLTANAASLAEKIYSLTPTKSLGKIENLSEYGLTGDGAVKVLVQYKDGTSDTLIYGSEGGESYGRYLLYKDEVYIVPVSTYLTVNALSFINTELVSIAAPKVKDEAGNETEGASELQSLTLSGTRFPQTIRVGLSEDDIMVYEMFEPISSGTGTTKTENIMAALQTVKAAGVVAVDATDEQMKEYGLDVPVAVAEYTINGESHKIQLGEKRSGLYGMLLDDSRTIYTVAEADVTEWADATLFSMRDGYVRLPNIKNVETLTVEAADGTDVYDVTRVLNEEKSTEENPFYDITIKHGGEDISYDIYQPFYKLILSVAVLNEELREPAGEPVLRYTYKYFDGGEDEVAFYLDSSADRRYVVTLNGEVNGIVRASTVDEILAAKPLLKQGLPIDGSAPEAADGE